MARLSWRFGGGDSPIRLFVALLMLMGAVYLASLWALRRAGSGKAVVAWIILVGAAARAITLPSAPILETDFYRYLWDGAVLAHGINPYTYAPSEVAEKAEHPPMDPALARLWQSAASEAPQRIFRSINHPHLRTIYPPVAQAAFAVSHWLKPWSLTAWCLTLLVFDVAALVLLAAVLRLLRLPLWCLAIYWWNPLLIKECYNTGHMDILAAPLVVGALLLAIRRRTLPATALLAVATGVKLWPVLLLPLFLRPELRNPKRLLPALALYAAAVAVLFLPVFGASLDASSGFAAYGQGWEMNDALFMLFSLAARGMLGLTGAGMGHAALLARALTVGALSAWVFWLCRQPATDGRDLCRRCLWVVAVAFLLSPTQFPWYFFWVLPFLAIEPRASLLLLTALLPLYYLRFHFKALDSVNTFDYGVVWAEYAPVWALLVWEGIAGRRRALAEGKAVAAS